MDTKTHAIIGDGHSALATAYIGEGSELVFLEMVGVPVSVRAIAAWMLLRENRAHISGVTIDGHQVHLEKDARYKVWMERMKKEEGDKRVKAVVHISHSSYCADGGQEEPFRVLCPADHDDTVPPPNFFELLSKRCRIGGLLAEDVDWLWKEGQESVAVGPYQRVCAVTVEGATGRYKSYLVKTLNSVWLSIVRQHRGLYVDLRAADRDLYTDDAEQWTIKRSGRWSDWNVWYKDTELELSGGNRIPTQPDGYIADVSVSKVDSYALRFPTN